MDHRRVYAHFTALLESVFFVIFNAVGKALAECKVAGGIFVKQGVVEHDAAVSYRAVIRYKCALAEHGRALVHGDHGLERLLVFLGVHLNYLAVFKADREVFYHNSPI